VYFEKSAKEDGGCGVGMLMWGLTLRHGWGCEKNEKVGFKWLRKAAEHAVGDLESARKGQSVDTGPVQVSKYVPVVLFFSECCNLPIQNELVLAIYEVGQCFFHGWGVGKDQKMAVVGTPFHVFYV
jgi:TPR repeat protein